MRWMKDLNLLFITQLVEMFLKQSVNIVIDFQMLEYVSGQKQRYVNCMQHERE